MKDKYKEKFHKEFNKILKLPGIGTYDIYSYCESFFKVKEMEEKGLINKNTNE